jgi:hypothetical protein
MLSMRLATQARVIVIPTAIRNFDVSVSFIDGHFLPPILRDA